MKLREPVLGLALTLLVTAILPAVAPASASRVGPLIPVGAPTLPASCDATAYRDAEVEATLAVDPRNPDKLVAGWMQGPGPGPAISLASASSRDGGESWSRPALLPGVSTCTGGPLERAVDPWLTYGPKGTVYFASLQFPDSAEPDLGPVVNRSTNNGKSWSDPVFVDRTPVFTDKEALSADPVRSGVAYMVWRQAETISFLSADIYFSRTDDGGRTWSDPVPIYETEPASPFEGAQIPEVVVTGPGRLVAVISTMPQLSAPGEPRIIKFLALRSKDGGRSWSAPTEIAETRSIQLGDPETNTPIREGSYVFTADGVPDSRVFVAWQDPQSATESKIMVSSSKGGREWSAPRLASKSAVAPFTPDLAVARNGTLGLRFYDLRNDVPGDSAFTTDSWFRHSHDGGRSWAEAKLGRGFNLRTAPVKTGALPGYQLGEYQGLVAVNKGFSTAFARAKPAAKEGATDIFYTSIKVKPGRACKKAKKQVKRAKKKLKKAKKSGERKRIKKAKKKVKKAKKAKKKAC